jgi:hypothetical protein
MKTSLTDFKIYLLNTTALGLTFAHIDIFLKLVLVLTTLGYTLHKWYIFNKNNKNQNK